jgi:nucleoside-diphosphate-sugar epimerase
MAHLLITGGSGYVGAQLLSFATNEGHGVTALGSTDEKSRWRLGYTPPPGIFDGVAAVIHLAHCWECDSLVGFGPENVNLTGSEKLAAAALLNGVSRFVFVSSVSARPDALNVYGRIKYLTEQKILSLPEANRRVVCARVGFVYGGATRGLYGLVLRLVKLTPILPMIGLNREVQPIHVEKVCKGLLALALGPPPAQPVYMLAGSKPIPFGLWLRLLRRVETGKRLFLVPVPIPIALLACRILRFVPFAPKVQEERVLGLASTTAVQSASDLEKLNVAVVDPIITLNRKITRRQQIREAAALLRYLTGSGVPTKAIIRLVHGVERSERRPLGLHPIFLKFPGLIRFVDPVWPKLTNSLARRIHLAAMVVESLPIAATRRFAIRDIVVQAGLEAIALPTRVLLGRLYKQ